ncbi:MAG TPA: TIGR03435 family protein [Bryobacteraceae bacterium]|jgi:uncharacterized protein (TIGR03435 family)|nr:TIGR03435 family protein [Bryobacteraceae bacterium]
MLACILATASQLAVANGPRFEVASVRPSAAGTRGILYHLPGDRLKVHGFTLLNLLSYAWDIPDGQIEGLPKWATTDHFDIEATPESGPSEPSKELESSRKKEMTRNLLAERFALTAHIQQRDVPAYSLLVAKNGPKIRRNTGAEYHIHRGKMSVDFQKVSMPALAKFLSANVRSDIGRMLFDKTDLPGEFDFKLEWAPLRAAANSDLPSIFGAVEQLGLKLPPEHGAARFLVVAHVKPPSEN